MRRRSNAIHSDSQEEFMMLAEFSQEKAGYFYDEKFREEVDRKLNKIHGGNRREDSEKKCGELSGFDYSTEQKEKLEESMELKQTCKRKAVNLAIISDHITEIRDILCKIFKKDEEATPIPIPNPNPQQQLLELFLAVQQNNLFKIWIIKATQMQNPLLTTYLTHAHRILNLHSQISKQQKLEALSAEQRIRACLQEMQHS